MSAQYLYRIHPIRNGFLTQSTPEEDAVIHEHFQYLERLTDRGVVLLAGRTLSTDVSSHGIVVFLADSDEDAQEIMEKDPAVAGGIFHAQLFPFRLALVGDAIKAL